MDALALPVLGVLIVAFLIYIWIAWLSDKSKRALQINDDVEDDAAEPYDPY